MSTRPRSIAAVLALAGLLTLTGCSVGLEDLPAPSGTNGPTYRVNAEFTDTQNLTLGAKVKLGGVVVGEVVDITTRDYRAGVAMNIEQKFPLGKDAHFQIRFTTPLGEDFVAITSAGHVDRGRLVAGGRVGLSQTSDAPSIEDTFAAVSTLLNQGGLGKLQVIASELDAAFKGRTGNARDALTQLDTVIADLDMHKNDIDRALDGLNRMATTLNNGTGVVEQALDLFPSALQILADDTAQVRDLLQRVGRLGVTVQGLLRRGQSALVSDLNNLQPTLDSLRARQGELIPTFQALIQLGKSVNRAAPGDYLNVAATVQFLLQAQPARPKPGGVVHSGSESPNAVVTQLLTGGLR